MQQAPVPFCECRVCWVLSKTGPINRCAALTPACPWGRSTAHCRRQAAGGHGAGAGRRVVPGHSLHAADIRAGGAHRRSRRPWPHVCRVSGARWWWWGGGRALRPRMHACAGPEPAPSLPLAPRLDSALPLLPAASCGSWRCPARPAFMCHYYNHYFAHTGGCCAVHAVLCCTCCACCAQIWCLVGGKRPPADPPTPTPALRPALRPQPAAA